MSQTVPAQHPAVVLRSHYRQLRSLLAVAMIAVLGLTVAVVMLATNDENSPAVQSAAPAAAAASAPVNGVRFDGGPEEGTRGIVGVQAPATRYDGGPEEGSRGTQISQATATRYDGGPDEGTAEVASRGPRP